MKNDVERIHKLAREIHAMVDEIKEEMDFMIDEEVLEILNETYKI